jgi:hypothetical protein
MNTNKHTPGPWDYDWHDGHIALYSDAQPDDYFARVEHSEWVKDEDWDGGENVPERIANARLIAAAPDLLAACEAVLASIHDPSDDDMFTFEDMLEKALAKARGEV